MDSSTALKAKSTKRSVRLKTLGCRLNIAESDALIQKFKDRGFLIHDEHTTSDVCIVNTCTVTDKADRKNRYYIRKAVRESQEMVVVTGCYAQTDCQEVAEILGVDLVVDNSQKGDIPQMVESLIQQKEIKSDPKPDLYSRFAVSMPHGHTRGYLKVQDGCNKSCSYCKIPRARGSAVSAPVDLLIANLHKLADAKIPEVVLTGVNIGWFRFDPNQNIKSLPRLLETLLGQNLDLRLRLSSIEPGDITAKLLDITTKDQNFTPFFHVPMQSGSDQILKKMLRGYTSANFIKRMQLIREKYKQAALVDQTIPEDYAIPFLSSDVITCFPGESEAHFEETIQTIYAADLNWLHLFPYSPRRQTEAAKLTDQIPKETVVKRMEKLRQVHHEIYAKYCQSAVTKTLRCVWQKDHYLSDNFLKIYPIKKSFNGTGLKSNDIPLDFNGAGQESMTRPTFQYVEVVDYQDNVLLGKPLS